MNIPHLVVGRRLTTYTSGDNEGLFVLFQPLHKSLIIKNSKQQEKIKVVLLSQYCFQCAMVAFTL